MLQTAFAPTSLPHNCLGRFAPKVPYPLGAPFGRFAPDIPSSGRSAPADIPYPFGAKFGRFAPNIPYPQTKIPPTPLKNLADVIT